MYTKLKQNMMKSMCGLQPEWTRVHLLSPLGYTTDTDAKSRRVVT